MALALARLTSISRKRLQVKPSHSILKSSYVPLLYLQLILPSKSWSISTNATSEVNQPYISIDSKKPTPSVRPKIKPSLTTKSVIGPQTHSQTNPPPKLKTKLKSKPAPRSINVDKPAFRVHTPPHVQNHTSSSLKTNTTQIAIEKERAIINGMIRASEEKDLISLQTRIRQYLADESLFTPENHNLAMEGLMNCSPIGPVRSQILELYNQLSSHPRLGMNIASFNILIKMAAYSHREVINSMNYIRNRVKKRQLASLARGPLSPPRKMEMDPEEKEKIDSIKSVDYFTLALELYTSVRASLKDRDLAQIYPATGRILEMATEDNNAKVALQCFSDMEKAFARSKNRPLSKGFMRLLQMFGELNDSKSILLLVKEITVLSETNQLDTYEEIERTGLRRVANKHRFQADTSFAVTKYKERRTLDILWGKAAQALLQTTDRDSARDFVDKWVNSAEKKDLALDSLAEKAESTLGVPSGKNESIQNGTSWYPKKDSPVAFCAIICGAMKQDPHYALSWFFRGEDLKIQWQEMEYLRMLRDAFNAGNCNLIIPIYRAILKHDFRHTLSNFNTVVDFCLAQLYLETERCRQNVLLDAILEFMNSYTTHRDEGRTEPAGESFSTGIMQRIHMALSLHHRLSDATNVFTQIIRAVEDAFQATHQGAPQFRTPISWGRTLISLINGNFGWTWDNQVAFRAIEQTISLANASNYYAALYSLDCKVDIPLIQIPLNQVFEVYLAEMSEKNPQLSKAQWAAILQTATFIKSPRERSQMVQRILQDFTVAMYTQSSEEWNPPKHVISRLEYSLLEYGTISVEVTRKILKALTTSTKPTPVVSEKSLEPEIERKTKENRQLELNVDQMPAVQVVSSIAVTQEEPIMIELPPSAYRAFPPSFTHPWSQLKIDSSLDDEYSYQAQPKKLFERLTSVFEKRKKAPSIQFLTKLCGDLAANKEFEDAQTCFELTYTLILNQNQLNSVQVQQWIHLHETLIFGFLDDKESLRYARSIFDFWLNSTVPLTTTAVEKIMRNSNPTMAVSLFERANATSLVPNIEVFTVLIQKLSEVGRTNDLITYFELLVGMGLKPTVYIYSTIIHAFCKTNRHVEAEHLFDTMIRTLNFQSNTFFYYSMMKTYARNYSLKRWAKIYSEKFLVDGVPTSETYDLLLEIESMPPVNKKEVGRVFHSLLVNPSVDVTANHWHAFLKIWVSIDDMVEFVNAFRQFIGSSTVCEDSLNRKLLEYVFGTLIDRKLDVELEECLNPLLKLELLDAQTFDFILLRLGNSEEDLERCQRLFFNTVSSLEVRHSLLLKKLASCWETLLELAIKFKNEEVAKMIVGQAKGNVSALILHRLQKRFSEAFKAPPSCKESSKSVFRKVKSAYKSLKKPAAIKKAKAKASQKDGKARPPPKSLLNTRK